MIKNFKLYTVGLLNKLEGPSEEDINDILKDNPNKLLSHSIKNNFKRGY